jgi:FkbM family methyltransferase
MLKILSLFYLLPNFKGKRRLFYFLKNLYLIYGKPIIWVKGNIGDIKIDLRSDECLYLLDRDYDFEKKKTVWSFVDENKINIDVGANIGFWSISMGQKILKLNGTGKVIAFEPYPENFKRLNENIVKNGLSKIIFSYQIALSEQEGFLDLVLRENFQNNSKTGNASISLGKNNDHDKRFSKIKIKAKKFDDFFSDKEIVNLGFVKIDIEGHEDCFFKGAIKLINKRVPVFFEIALTYYRAKGIEDKDIINFFNTIFNKYVFYDGLKLSTDLSNLKISNISNILALPYK